MNKYLVFIFSFAVLITQTNCTDIEPFDTEPEDISLIFESFVLEKENNPQLKEDIVFNIGDHAIDGELKKYFHNAIPTFFSNAHSIEVDDIKQVSSKSSVDFRESITYILKSNSGESKKYTIKISWDDTLAHLHIKTEGGASINSKEDYLNGVITINGESKYSDFTSTARIRGRGNTTWTYPKKPFKIKLDHEESIFGLAAEKDWVLLANYLDNTHLLNAVGMKIGQLLEMPFTNTMIPVEVTLNNKYLGLYMLTEQIEAKPNRVDIGEEGILLNLDTNFDEEWQFKSESYHLPVTIKYPKKTIDSDKLTLIKNQFEALEVLIASADFPNNNYLDYIDDTSIANYIITYMLTGNEEINHPKSTYIHKTGTGKFNMGPIWDFDWGFAYEGSFQHFSSFDRPLFWSPASKGTQFFSKLLTDPKIRTLVKKNWVNFQSNKLSELLTYIDAYDFIIDGAKDRDFAIWNQPQIDKSTLKIWIKNRSNYMNNFIDNL